MAPSYSLQELAALVGGEVVGNPDFRVSGFNSIELAANDEITFAASSALLGELAGCSAAAAVVPLETEYTGLPCIRTVNPEYAAAVIHNHFLAAPFRARGVHPSAHIGEGCEVPFEVTVGPLACIGDRVRLGRRVTVSPGVVIGSDSVIGDDTFLHPNVTIGDHSVLGSRVIIHSGTVIGSDGFGYATDEAGNHLKKPQVGNVQIDDDVEIGANSCVDRAAFGTTRVRSGARIDNLVMIAHNVDIGENSILVAQVGIAGSTTLGRNAVLGGKAGVAGHLHIGNRVMIAGMAGVHSDLPDNAMVGGAPAFELKKWRRAISAIPRLPDMAKELRHLRREIERLSALLEKTGGNTD